MASAEHAISDPRRAAFAALRAELSARTAAGAASHERVSSRVPSLDRLLGGGFPQAALVSLEGRSGRWSIAARMIAQATQHGVAAVVDDGGLYPPSLARAGALLERVLIVPARAPLQVARVTDILVRSRTCQLVVVPAIPLRGVFWMRLAAAARRNGVLLIAVCERPGCGLASAARRRVRCSFTCVTPASACVGVSDAALR
jgi:hypothetical protein